MVLKRCCCFTLDSGVLVLGVSSLLISLFHLVNSLLNFSESFESFRASVHDNIFPDPAEHWLHIIYFSYAILDILSDVLFIIGIVKRKRQYLLPWLVLFWIMVILTLLEHSLLMVAILICIACSIPLGLLVYFWYSAYSLYYRFKMEDLENQTGVQMVYVEDSKPLPNYNILTEK